MLPMSTTLEKINPLEGKNTLSTTEFYLTLVITDKKVKSGIWVADEEGVRNLAFGSPENWSGENAEELIVAADSSIASAVANLPLMAGKQPSKVIFGLPEYWVRENSINKEKSNILQTVCKKLLLKPMGFVVTPEAIAYFLKKEEGGFPQAVLVSLGETEIIVSLIIQGKFLGSKVVGRSDNLALDLEEGLLRFDYHGELPSRILLINDGDGENLEDDKQNLVAYPWIGPEGGKKLNFLQLPKVEIAREGIEVSSVVLAGGRELGQEPKPSTDYQELVTEEKTGIGETEPVLPAKEEEKEEEWSEADFGFIQDKDVLLEIPPGRPEEKVEEKIEEKKQIIETVAEEAPRLPEVQEETMPKKRIRLPNLPLKNIILKPIAFIKRIFPFKRPKVRQETKFLPVIGKESSRPFRLILLPAIFFLMIFSGGFFGFWKFCLAEVKIFIRPLRVDKAIEFTISSKISSVDEVKMMIPSRQLSIEIDGEKTAAVTGKKTVGDKATGEVVIYNGTDKTKTFPKGTILKGPGGLKFILAEEASVSGKLTDLGAVPPVDKWGEKKVPAAAAEIGAQYNLAGSSTLSLEGIATSSSWLIRNPTAFSGGTSREIQAVSIQDKENLQRSLIKELEEKALTEAKNQLTAQDRLLPDPIQLKSKTDRFNHEVDDETDSLALEEKAVFNIVFFKEDDFKILSQKVISQLIPDGYEDTPVKQEISFETKDKNKGTYLAKILGDILPKVNTAEIVSAIKGKAFSQSEPYLKNIKDSGGFDVLIRPKIFSKLKLFPLRESNINIIIEAI